MSASFGRRDFLSKCGKGIAVSAALPALARSGASWKTGYAYDPLCAGYYQNSAETPERVVWINDRIKQSSIYSALESIVPLDNPVEWIAKVHSDEHIASIQAIGAYDSNYQPSGPIADLAAAYALGAVESVCSGKIRNAFCCIRPPGHHVQDGGYPMGYCFYANVVIAARYAQLKFGLQKVLIIDWDYHQGNGTHGHLCGNDGVLFFETFSPDMYTTACEDFSPIGPNAQVPESANRINIRMPSGSSNNDFAKVFEEKLVPAADRFKPELILISCGFDLKKHDTHGSFNVTAAGVSRLTRIVMDIAEKHAQGRIVSMLEGGYADSVYYEAQSAYATTYHGLSQCASNHLATLATGELQPESEFYAQSNVIRKSPRTHTPYVNTSNVKGRVNLQGRQLANGNHDNHAMGQLQKSFFMKPKSR